MNNTEKLLDILQSSHLVETPVVEKLRAQVQRSSRPVTPQDVLKLLIDKGQVTSVQAKRLLSQVEAAEPSAQPAASSPSPAAPEPAAEEDELGLAPLEEDEPPATKPWTRKPAVDDSSGLTPVDEDDAELVAVDDIDEEDLAPLDDEPAGITITPENVIDSPVSDEAVTLDEGDLVEQENGAVDLFGDPLGAAVAAHAGDDLLGAPAEKKLRGWQSKRIRKNIWDSPLLLIGGGALLLLVIMFFALLWANSRGSGDDLLAQANADFEAGSYTQAINKYDEYLNRFPAHHGVSKARVNRGLAVLRKAVEGTSDWPQALQVAKQVLEQIEPEADFSTARPDLANLLPEIAAGLARQARGNPQQAFVDQSEEALSLVHANIPTSLKIAVQLNGIEESLAFTRHTLARDARTDEALIQIAAAIEPITGDSVPAEAREAFETAYDVRRKLLRDYPELEVVDTGEETSPAARRTRQLAERLAESALGVSRAELEVVRFVRESAEPLLVEPDSPLRQSIALAHRGGAQVQAESKTVFLLAAGAAYGLDATTGAVRWRRFVGFDTTYVPVSVAGAGAGDALLADSIRHEIVHVNAATGDLRWRCPLEDEFDATPLVLRDVILMATGSGRLVRIDLKTGAKIGHTSFPQDLRVAPALSERNKLIYQVGEHSNLYVLSAEDGQCREVSYLTHLPGTVRVPPVLLGRYLIVVENDKLRDATLRVLLTDENGLSLKQVHSESLTGHVDVSPVVAGNGRLLMIATDRGALYAFEIGAPGQARHLTLVAERAPVEDEPATRYPLVRGTQLWVAGRELTRYDIRAASGKLSPLGVIAGNSTHLQTPVSVGNAVIHVRRAAGLPGVVVAAHNADRVNPIWETRLATPLAIPPRVESNGTITAVTTTAAYFNVDAGSLSDSAVLDTPAATIKVTTPPRPPRADSTTVELADGTLVVGAGVGEKRMLLLNASTGDRPLRWLPLGQAISAPPVGFAGGLMVPVADGMILVVDPRDGRSLMEPFQPRLTSGVSLTWTRPEPVGEKQVVVADGQAKIFLLGVSSDPKPHLAAVSDATVTDPIIAPPSALPGVVYAADAAGKLLAFGLPELKPGGDWSLGTPPAWGPQRIGDVVLVATTTDELLCLDEGQQLRWRVPMTHGALAGNPLSDGESLILAHKSGVVARVSAKTGQEQAAVQTNQSWATGAVRMADGLLLGGHDGSLHVIDVP